MPFVALAVLLTATASAQVTWTTIYGPITEPLDAVDHVGTDGSSLFVVFSNPWNQRNGGQQFWKYTFGAGDPLHGTWNRLPNPPRTVCSSDSCSDLAYQDGYLYTSALATGGGRTVIRYDVAANGWHAWQNGGVDVNISSTTGNGIFMDAATPGVGYSAWAGGGWWVRFDWDAKTANNNWMSTAGLGVTDAAWVSRNEDVAVSSGTYYATKNDKSAGLSSGDVIYAWNSLSSPVPAVLAAKPWQAGFGQAIQVIPGSISPSGHDELWLVRGADGSTNPGEGYGNPTANWARLDLTNPGGGWAVGSLPSPVAYSGEIALVGHSIFVRGQYSRWYVTTQYQPIGLSAAKALADGTVVDLWGIVTAGFPAAAPNVPQYYIENPDRSCGIQVRYSGTALTGAVTVTGAMRTDLTTTERYVEATGWSPSGDYQAIEPLAMNTRALGGGPRGLQQGVYQGKGLNNVGLLVTVCGKVTAREGIDSCWYVSDGSGRTDGTGVGIRADLAGFSVVDRPSPDLNDKVVVTGICSTYVGSHGQIHAMVRARGGGDCRDLSFRTFKAIVVNCDPHCPGYGNVRTHEVYGWGDPHVLCQTYIDDLKFASNGFGTYEVVDWIDCEYHTIFEDGFQYTPDDYVYAWNNRSPTTPMHPGGMDYPRFMTDKIYPHNNPRSLAERAAAGEFEEVLLFGSPGGDGRWEASMVGPKPFNVNGLYYTVPECGRNVIVMGFNYERGVDCMLEDFCHRSECIMTRVYKRWNWSNPQNNWEFFTQIDKYRPGNAACGNCHYAPNSMGDYNWDNTRYVWSTCDDWLYNWPNLQGASTKRWVNCIEWGNGDMRLHHVWWFKRFPKRGGVNPDGKQNNWWKYLCDYNSYPESR
jgi:hypothetical protein